MYCQSLDQKYMLKPQFYKLSLKKAKIKKNITTFLKLLGLVEKRILYRNISFIYVLEFAN